MNYANYKAQQEAAAAAWMEAHADELIHRDFDPLQLLRLGRVQPSLGVLSKARREVIEDAREAVRGRRRDREDVPDVPQRRVVRRDALELGELAQEPRPRALNVQATAVEPE